MSHSEPRREGALTLAGYCRVSTDNQKEEGTIEIQQKALVEYAKANRHELVEVFSDEGISGAREPGERRGWIALYNYLDEHGAHGVLVYKLDRLARDLRIQENIIHDLQVKKAKAIISIKEPDMDSTDPVRVLMRQILGSFAEYEKKVIAMRLRAGRLNKARKGRYAGGVAPTGYRAKEKELTIDAEEAQLVRAIFHMKRYRRMSLRAIAEKLNQQGIPTPKGGERWYASSVQYILRNNVYRGVAAYECIRVKNAALAVL